MSLPATDLSHFKKKIRGKIRLAILAGELLHFIYLVVKNFMKSPDQLTKYDSFQQLVSDKKFVMEVLRKESRSGKLESDPLKYLKYVNTVMRRGYTGLLEVIDTVWDLTVHHNRIDSRTLFNGIIGLTLSKLPPLDKAFLYENVSYSQRPFIMNIKHYNFVVVEAELGRRVEALAKTLVYIGSLANTNVSLGLFARFSIRSIDAERIVSKQNSGYAHRLLKMFRFYPTVLRMQRHAYKKVGALKKIEDEVLNMLSELYMDNDEIISLINMDAPANILSMVPSISLGGGLCFATVFRGELINTLGAGKEARIKVADAVIKAYPAYYSVLPHQNYPGDYLFMAFHPFTIPKICLVVATYPVNILNELEPKRRNIVFLDKLFPKVEEVAKTYL